MKTRIVGMEDGCYIAKRDDGLHMAVDLRDIPQFRGSREISDEDMAVEIAEEEFRIMEGAAGSRVEPVYHVGQTVTLSSPALEKWLRPSRWSVVAINRDSETVILKRL